MHFFILPVKKHCATKKCICKGMTPQFAPWPSVSSCFGVALGREPPSLWILVQGTLPVSTRAMWKILPGPQQPRFVGFSRNDGWRTRRLWCKHVHEVKYVGCEGLWSNTCATICNIYIYICKLWHLDILRIHYLTCQLFFVEVLNTISNKYVNVQAQLLTSVAGWVDTRETCSLSNQSKRTNPSCDVWTNPSCFKETSGSSQLQ